MQNLLTTKAVLFNVILGFTVIIWFAYKRRKIKTAACHLVGSNFVMFAF